MKIRDLHLIQNNVSKNRFVFATSLILWDLEAMHVSNGIELIRNNTYTQILFY